MDPTPVLLTGDLKGPHGADARRMIEISRSLTYAQAAELAAIWETDTNPEYDEHCAAVKAALASTSRELPLGWFEAVFSEVNWTSTKALHAIADAVVATLVKDEVSHAAFFALIRPWWQYMSKNVTLKVDLRRIKEICLT